MKEGSLNIAIVGIGVAGMTAAYILQQKHQITLFEKNDYLGGHTNTIVLDKGPDAGTPVDTGFIVFNDRTYPLFNLLLSRLSVPIQNSDMSFSFHDEKKGFYYSGTNINTLFAQRRNLIELSFYRMIREIIRFNMTARSDLYELSITGLTLGEYLKKRNFIKSFIDNYLIPMGSAIWSTSPEKIFDFPAERFIKFFENHGLLNIQNRPKWKTVLGGSQSYIKTFLEIFKGTVNLNTRIQNISRTKKGITILMEDGRKESFDALVLGTHADEAWKLLKNPTEDEKRLLGAWDYEKNHVILHTDESVMPPNHRAWSSWNYCRESGRDHSSPVSLTYYMNRLQRLQTRNNYFVSLNRQKPIPRKYIIRELDYTHPGYTFKSIETQRELHKLNGIKNTYYCGSYFGNGFHEDAVKSAVEIGKLFGLEL